MSKKLSEEQVREAFEKQFKDADLDFSYSERGCFYFDDVTCEIFEGFKAAFTLLMPIIERQQEALNSHDCSFVFWPTGCHQCKAIKETKQMLEQLNG